MSKLRVIDLFAGIAGFSLGLHRAGGFETVKFCEMKPHAQRVLAKNFPGVPCHDDVTTYDFKPGEADVITAGFPCQDISFAGDGAGLAGARSGLYREVIRALRVVRPLYAILENVAALLSRGLDVVLGDMAEIGYDAEWHCIPASAVGAPHRRDRIWIVAHPECEQGSERYDADVLGRRSGETKQTGLGGSSTLSGYLERAMANTASERRDETGQLRRDESSEWLASGGEEMANADSIDVQGLVAGLVDEEGRAGSIQRQAGPRGHGLGWWAVEPDVGRVAHGVPMRVDRLAELGNAVVPKIPEIIGRAILQARAA